MENKPIVLMTFASNGLASIPVEADEVFNVVKKSEVITAHKIENVDIEKLADTIADYSEQLFMFHFGGHSNQRNIVLEGLRDLDKIRLSRLLLPKEKHNLQIVFLNGCLSYGHVGILTAKGVKAIIATNVKVNDSEAERLAGYFYKLFFEKNYTLKAAFEGAEATVTGSNSFPIVVNPGEINETKPMPSSWTLFVHTKHTEVLNWTLRNFLKNESGLKLKFNSLTTARWSKSFYIDFSLMNVGKDMIIVDDIIIEIVDIADLLKIKEIENGAPLIPIKGVVELDNKLGKYKIVFENNGEEIQRFSFSHNQIDNMFVEIQGKSGYTYECRVVVNYYFANDFDKIHITTSDIFTITYPFTSATEILSML